MPDQGRKWVHLGPGVPAKRCAPIRPSVLPVLDGVTARDLGAPIVRRGRSGSRQTLNTWLATSDHAFRPWGVPRTWPKPVQNRPKPPEIAESSKNALITEPVSSTKSDCCGCCAPSKFIHSRFICTAVSNPFHSNFTAVRMAAGRRSGAPRRC